MSAVVQRPTGSPYSAKNLIKPINFYCAAPGAKAVFLTGDFNGWNAATIPMVKRVDGWWFVQVLLTHGHHRYQFLVDGVPTLDPHATGITRDDRLGHVSVIAVS